MPLLIAIEGSQASGALNVGPTNAGVSIVLYQPPGVDRLGQAFTARLRSQVARDLGSGALAGCICQADTGEESALLPGLDDSPSSRLGWGLMEGREVVGVTDPEMHNA